MNPRRFLIGFAACAALVVAIPRSFGLTTNSVGLVLYTAFDGTSYTLKPWFGQNVAVLTPNSTSYQSNVMAQITTALDQAYAYYRRAMGRQPALFDSTVLEGRDTIAVVNSTCGAGCSYVGFTGTEILNQYFQILYNGVATANQYDQVLFYEFGRNFWFYGSQLDYQSPDVDPVGTGFAVYMRFMAMSAIGVAGGPYNGTPFPSFAGAVTNLIDSYVLSSSLNWSNTFRLSTAPDNSLGLGGTDLIASLLMRIGRDFGGTNFASDFWHQARLLSSAQSTQQAADNFVLTACGATHANLTHIFATTWKWPVSAAASQQAQTRWDNPVQLPAHYFVQNAGNNSLKLSWQTEAGVFYQRQESLDLQTWTNVGAPVVGNGSVRSVFAPDNLSPQRFFRLQAQ
jgi:serralysin